jgi:hypothetical protein
MNYTGSVFNMSFYKDDGSTTDHGEIGNGWYIRQGVRSKVVLNWMMNQAEVYGLSFSD